MLSGGMLAVATPTMHGLKWFSRLPAGSLLVYRLPGGSGRQRRGGC